MIRFLQDVVCLLTECKNANFVSILMSFMKNIVFSKERIFHLHHVFGLLTTICHNICIWLNILSPLWHAACFGSWLFCLQPLQKKKKKKSRKQLFLTQLFFLFLCLFQIATPIARRLKANWRSTWRSTAKRIMVRRQKLQNTSMKPGNCS